MNKNKDIALQGGLSEMVTIDRVETLLLDLPTIRPHQLSMTTMQGQTLMIVRIYCSDGSVGVGEGTTIGGLAYGAESPEGMKLAIDTYFTPLLVGQRADAVPELMQRLVLAIKDNRFAKSAVETALYDALGQRLDLPVSMLLGGPVRDRLEVAWTLASGDTVRDIEEAETMVAMRRHRVFKLKIGKRSVAQDVAHVAAIKKAVGDRATVRVDINMAWSELEARYGIPALADVGCELVEQPVVSAAALKRLSGKYPIALMADESLTGPESAFALAQTKAPDVFAIKIEQSGGLRAAQKVAAIAEAAQIELYGGTMLEGSIGTAASAHTFSTFHALEWGTELFGPLLLTEDILTSPLRYENFELHIPQGAGLGIALDEERVQFFNRERRKRSVSLVAG